MKPMLRAMATLLLPLALAGCGAGRIEALPKCTSITELRDLRVGMPRSEVETMIQSHRVDYPEGAIAHQFPVGSRLESLYVRFDGDRASEIRAVRYFQLDNASQLPGITAELRRELVTSLGDPDETRSGYHQSMGRAAEIELTTWRRPCGWIVAAWNTDEDVRRMLSKDQHVAHFSVSVALSSPGEAEQSLASFVLEGTASDSE